MQCVAFAAAVLSQVTFVPVPSSCPQDILEACHVPHESNLGCANPASDACGEKRKCIVGYFESCEQHIGKNDTSPDWTCTMAHWEKCGVPMPQSAKSFDPCKGATKETCAERLTCMGQVGTECPGMSSRLPYVKQLPEILTDGYCIENKIEECGKNCADTDYENAVLECVFGKSVEDVQTCVLLHAQQCGENTKCLLGLVNTCLGKRVLSPKVIDVLNKYVNKCGKEAAKHCLPTDGQCMLPLIEQCLMKDSAVRKAVTEGQACVDKVLSTACPLTSTDNPCADGEVDTPCFAAYECVVSQANMCLDATVKIFEKSGSSGLAGWAIALIVVFVLLAVAVAAFVVYRMCFAKRSKYETVVN